MRGLLAMDRQRRKNLRTAAALLLLVGVMVTLVSYSVPLYRLFCAVTGYGGTTQIAEVDVAGASNRIITVRFDTAVAPNLPWRFMPEQRQVKVHLGEEKLVFFSAENLGDTAIVGHATFNVLPETTGIYFKKIQCFCFDDERLEARRKVEMPVDFFVDPALAKDPNTRNIDSITLSYTFFRSVNSGKVKNLSRFDPTAAPNPANGQALFAQRCAACHALDRNKVGPMLEGVFGRTAGSIPGYSYSTALREAGIKWSADNLDHWLSNPRGFVAGARMPVRVIEPTSRRDIIAYLRQQSPDALMTSTIVPGVQHAP